MGEIPPMARPQLPADAAEQLGIISPTFAARLAFLHSKLW
jgi:hypothetical protein